MEDVGTRTWGIGEAERFTGLRRRSIQRVFYSGQGGGNIAAHAPRGWGQGSYDVNDLAKLFLVAQLEGRGDSLLAACRRLSALMGEHQLAELLAEERGRLSEQLDVLLDRYVCAEALEAALGEEPGRTERLRDVRSRAAAAEAALFPGEGPGLTSMELLDDLLETGETRVVAGTDN